VTDDVSQVHKNILRNGSCLILTLKGAMSVGCIRIVKSITIWRPRMS